MKNGGARRLAEPGGDDFSRAEHVERVDGVGGARRPAEPTCERSAATRKNWGTSKMMFPLYSVKGIWYYRAVFTGN